MRAFKVRVARSTSGKSASTLPRNICSGKAAAWASARLPGASHAASDSGTSALTQTVERPLIRNNGAPVITVIPSRVLSSPITPALGAVKSARACTRPVASTRAIWSSGIPARRMRCRAPSNKDPRPSIPECVASRFAAKNSSCTATHSGM